MALNIGIADVILIWAPASVFFLQHCGSNAEGIGRCGGRNSARTLSGRIQLFCRYII
jgi:hypothetical protein